MIDSQSTDKLALIMKEIEQFRNDSEICNKISSIEVTWKTFITSSNEVCVESMPVPSLTIKF